jgi:uncharacterized protein YutE (UPF0331/DUF86 family)
MSDGRFEFFLKGAQEFCRAVGLHESLMLQIYHADADWTFILQTDALHETALRELLRRSLKLEINQKFVGERELHKFVGHLPVNGRTSLAVLLRATGCDKDVCEFIEATRQLRNEFAHSITNADKRLLEVLRSRSDSSSVLKRLAPIEEYDEDALVAMIEKDSGIFRYMILHQTLRLLTIVYHVAIKEKVDRLSLEALSEERSVSSSQPKDVAVR